MSRLRIAIVAESFPPAGGGGIAASHYHLYRLFKAAGSEVLAFTYTAPSAAADDGNKDVARRSIPALAERVIYKLVRRLFWLLDRGRAAYQSADILKSILGAYLLNKPLRRFSPDILILPDQGAPGLAIRKLPGCKTLLVAHHNPARFLDEPLFGDYSKIDAGLALWLEQRALKKIDQVICPSRHMKDMFASTYRFQGKVKVIPNLIDARELDGIKQNDVREALGIPAECAVVYIPSAGSKYKGARFVSQIVKGMAAKAQGRIGFYLSGNIADRYKKELWDVPENASLFMPGHLPNAAHLAYVKSCSFAISPTLIENFSMAFLEAMFMGVPVLTFDVGGNRDLVEEGKSGFLAPLGDVSLLISLGVKLLDGDELARLQETARESARKRFAPELWLDEWLA